MNLENSKQNKSNFQSYLLFFKTFLRNTLKKLRLDRDAKLQQTLNNTK